MEKKESSSIRDFAGNLPNELVMMAYYPAINDFGIMRYGPNGDNPEFFKILTEILNPNFETIIQYKKKILNKNYLKAMSDQKENHKRNLCSTKYERLIQSLENQESSINQLEAIRKAFFNNLAKLTPEKISSFLDGVPVIEQSVKTYNYLYLNATTMIASKNSVVFVFSVKEDPPSSIVVYTAKDKEKVDSALLRKSTSKSQPEQKCFDLSNKNK